ncbi:hypothetical protein tloyanaT_04010 [Thalassotalea loyana]|uniref:Exonuclease domain-containing protein n=1 Tax=Thalassotalea loyana TaxID=280483 RepID=A0ABQ6H845_9GAMM|nr:exonuclease domain-containing protein [Thalassotalea loyana]GLX84149.1 hypothetical protein tloyanaT_04010 [Thalassotalea loyana]
MDFIAIDVETANPDMASICQIGIAKFSNGILVDEWSSLINPEDDFSYFNTKVHGITEGDVVSAPTFPEVADKLREFMQDNISVCHTHFDKGSVSRALSKYNLDGIETRWLDSAKVARRTWEEFKDSGYGLANVCDKIGFQFKHHDALEDAKACGHVLLAALNEKQLNVEEMLTHSNRPITDYTAAVNKEGNPDGDLYGEVMVFTGALEIPRKEAAEIAAKAGCEVVSGVTKKVSLLVVGDQDITKLAGKSKSSKHLKAETLIEKGHAIRILKESDFIKLVNV